MCGSAFINQISLVYCSMHNVCCYKKNRKAEVVNLKMLCPVNIINLCFLLSLGFLGEVVLFGMFVCMCLNSILSH